MKNEAFVIMRIGDKNLDEIWSKVYVPVIKKYGLEPKRVDKHNEGRLLNSEIAGFIKRAKIIIADLTDERPNCYLEVGYTMGLNKFSNLILTAREDHNIDSPNYKKDGHKIHFDLSGYDILFWDPKDVTGFKNNLEKRIKHRLDKIMSFANVQTDIWDKKWLAENKELAIEKIHKMGLSGYMEIQATLINSDLNVSQGDLLKLVKQSVIHTSGWPLGIVLSREDSRPKSKANGIVAEVIRKEERTYDYWTIRKDGSFHLLKSLFEDERQPSEIHFNIRIARITEALFFSTRLYKSLTGSSASHIVIGIRHGGLRNRVLTSSSPARLLDEVYGTIGNEVYTEINSSIENIEENLVDFVEKFADELFVIFNFTKIDKRAIGDMVNNFIKGKIT